MTAGSCADGAADIVVTGANGFVGSAVVRELVARGLGGRVAVLVRRPVPDWVSAAGVRVRYCDLTDAASLVSGCSGASALVHLASRIDSAEDGCRAVNEDGTRRLLAEARGAGVGHVVHLSTCAVYRDGDHRGAVDPPTGPVSPASRTRLAGERLVRAAGGVVLRPHLVHGPGDRHVVPSLVRWLQAVPGWAAGGNARTSHVGVTDLAAVIVTLALAPRMARPGDAFHVAEPRPVRMRDLITMLCRLLDLPLPVVDLPLEEHRARTRAALPSLTEHQYSLFTRDHWYESGRVWASTGVAPGPGLARRLAEAAGWYREWLGLPESVPSSAGPWRPVWNWAKGKPGS